MASNTAAAGAESDVTDDVNTMTSPSRRAVDFSISSLLSSRVGRSSGRVCSESTSLMLDNCTYRQLQLNSSAAVDSAALLHQRLAAATATLWYPWLHSVASLQSTNIKQHLTRGKFLFFSSGNHFRILTYHYVTSTS